MTSERAGAAPHLFLVGMMGSGKTTVGRLCARALDRPFVDLDDRVERRSGRTVGAVFAEEGEEAFRRLESEALGEVASSPVPSVVACGGGVVLDAANRGLLRAAGVVVWLRAPAELLAGRVGLGEGRPLLAASPGGVEGELDRLGAEREPAYRDASHSVVDASSPDPAAVAERVLAAFRSAVASVGATPGPAAERP